MDKGTEEDPDPEIVTDEMVPELMSYPGEWALFRMHEAGGNGYMDFDNVGDDGPGYIMCPGVDVFQGDKNGYYRFSCRVKNVNENSQEQSLQSFTMDATESQIVVASTKPMVYNEWTECTWIGQARTESTQFMAFGWQGEVLIDSYKVEKLVYPLDTPVITDAVLNDDGSVTLSWDKVEGATSYSVEVNATFVDDPLASAEVTDETSCTLTFDLSVTEQEFTFYVTAHNGEEISYPGYLVKGMTPESVGTPVALPATEVSKDGFTANWEKAPFAYHYLVLPTVTHTAATDNENYFILDENFSNVPESADEFSPIQVCPLMGKYGMDLYMSRAGWSTDMGVFIRLIPDMPMFAITNQYASMGIQGILKSPVTDFSVGGGKVKVTGTGISSLDDAILQCGLMDASGEIYSSEDIEVTLEGTQFEVELTGGKADSQLFFVITDSAEGGDMVLFPNISVAVNLNAGESITVPAVTVHADDVTSAFVASTPNDLNLYTYTVQGYFNSSLIGEMSNSIIVNTPSSVDGIFAGAKASVRTVAGILKIDNPAGEDCTVCTLDGKILYRTSSASATVPVKKGLYVVKVGDRTFKVMN